MNIYVKSIVKTKSILFDNNQNMWELKIYKGDPVSIVQLVATEIICAWIEVRI